MAIESQRHTEWSLEEHYILCKLREQGRSNEYISKVLLGRSRNAVSVRYSQLKTANKYKPGYWSARMVEKGMSLPTEELMKPKVISNITATDKKVNMTPAHVAKADTSPVFEEQNEPEKKEPILVRNQSVELMVNDMFLKLGPGSEINLPVGSLTVEIKIKTT